MRRFFTWFFGKRRRQKIAITYVARVRIEGADTHYDVRRLELVFAGGKLVKGRDVPGNPMMLLTENV